MAHRSDRLDASPATPAGRVRAIMCLTLSAQSRPPPDAPQAHAPQDDDDDALPALGPPLGPPLSAPVRRVPDDYVMPCHPGLIARLTTDVLPYDAGALWSRREHAAARACARAAQRAHGRLGVQDPPPPQRATRRSYVIK